MNDYRPAPKEPPMPTNELLQLLERAQGAASAALHLHIRQHGCDSSCPTRCEYVAVGIAIQDYIAKQRETATPDGTAAAAVGAGTFNCPICNEAEPHAHSDEAVADWKLRPLRRADLAAQESRRMAEYEKEAARKKAIYDATPPDALPTWAWRQATNRHGINSDVVEATARLLTKDHPHG